jgi:L-methionine (R)-S-oxide reductase
LCGAAATSGRTVAVNNVAADPRYLGSDMVKSNLVAPIFAKTSEAKTSEAKKRVVAEICIESYFANTFTAAETAFIEACAALVGRYIEKSGDRAI